MSAAAALIAGDRWGLPQVPIPVGQPQFKQPFVLFLDVFLVRLVVSCGSVDIRVVPGLP